MSTRPIIFHAMTTYSTLRRGIGSVLCPLLLLTVPARGQTEASTPLEPPSAKVVVLPVALYNAQAN